MKLYILRHGETKINTIGGRFQGQINTPEAALTENGIEQAREVAREFKDKGFFFDKVYSSPQERAMQTAVLASGAEESQLILDDRLKEMDFGPLEGMEWKYMEPAKFKALMDDFGNYLPGPGMESGLTLIRRVSMFLEDMKRKNTEESVLVSTHGGVVRAALVNLHVDPLASFWRNPVGNCGWIELTLTDGKWVLTDLDRKEHRDYDQTKN